jgi:hypothetical protein
MMSSIATAVYALAFLASTACSALLIRSYIANRTKLLAWVAACFVLLALNNFFLVADMILLPDWDLSYTRILLALSAVATLLYGFVWELD